MKKYVLLGDDLDLLIRGFEKDPHRSERQRKIWRRSGRKKAITREMFGNDRDNSLRLDDGPPVGSVAANTARRFWDYNDGHVFPPDQDLICAGIFFHCGLHKTLALVLKGRWEHYFAHEIKGWRSGCGERLIDILLDADDPERMQACRDFQPDPYALFGLFEELAGLPQAVASGSNHAHGGWMQGLDSDDFAVIVGEMVLSQCFLMSQECRELSGFVKKKQKERALLVKGTPEQQQEYILAKSRWVQLAGEVEDLYFSVENRRLKNAHIRRDWLREFGQEEIELAEQAARYEAADYRHNLMLAYPDWDRERIERKARGDEKERVGKVGDLTVENLCAVLYDEEDFQVPDGSEGTDPEEYFRECKKVLRAIRKLLHPDRLAQDPVYGKLTGAQKEKLTGMLHKALEVRPEELIYPKGFALHEFRSLEALKRALGRVEAILNNPGVDLDEQKEIQGDTLPEKLAWLEKENAFLEDEVDAARAQLRALAEDPETLGYAAVLKRPEDHPRIKEDFRRRIEEYRKQADALEKELMRNAKKREEKEGRP